MATRTKTAALVSLAVLAAAAVPAEQASAWGQPELVPSCTQVEYRNATWQGKVELTVWVDGSHVTTVVTDRAPFTIPLNNPGPGMHRIGVRAREVDNPKAAERYREVTEDCGRPPAPPVVVPPPPVAPPAVAPPAVTPPAVTPPAKSKPPVCKRLPNGKIRIERSGTRARLVGFNLTKPTWTIDRVVRVKGHPRSIKLSGQWPAGQRVTVKAKRLGLLNGKKVVCGSVERSLKFPNRVPPSGGGRG